MATVFDVAAYILRKRGRVTAMKLQKLVYYSQAWSTVWDDDILFNERIEAWANGPVCPPLFEAHQGKYHIHDGEITGDPDQLSSDQRDTVDSVIDYYADKSSQYLSDLTHREQPWIQARKDLSPRERGCVKITPATMEEYYGSL